MATRNRLRTMVTLLVATVAATVIVRASIGAIRPPALTSPAVLDLGFRERGEIVLARFPVGNQGGRPLILEKFQTSCSCAGVEREENGKFVCVRTVVVPPGQANQAVLVVTYDITAAGKASIPRTTSVRLTVAVDGRESEAEIPVVIGEEPS